MLTCVCSDIGGLKEPRTRPHHGDRQVRRPSPHPPAPRRSSSTPTLPPPARSTEIVKYADPPPTRPLHGDRHVRRPSPHPPAPRRSSSTPTLPPPARSTEIIKYADPPPTRPLHGDHQVRRPSPVQASGCLQNACLPVLIAQLQYSAHVVMCFKQNDTLWTSYAKMN